MREIKQPLIVEAEHWNKLVDFIKEINNQQPENYDMNIFLLMDNRKKSDSLLKEIGEFE